jgi:Secretion system C-terminal sorting domain
VQRFVGAGVHIIPFGNSSGEDISFGFTTSPPTGFQTGSLRISTYQTLPDNTPYPIAPFTINHVNNTSGVDNSANTVDRFWNIENAGVSSYTFRYAPSENAANGNVQMRAQPWNALNAGWSLPPLGQINPGIQQVMVPGIVPIIPGVLSGQTWAITMNSTPLPVELLSFSARRNSESEVICEWTTLTETNNDYFEVQRSKDGIYFETIGSRNGAGNSTTLLQYMLYDYTATNEIIYYRLKQVDFDGQYSYSKTIVLSPVTSDNNFRLFPNPASTDVYISPSPNTTFQYCIYDLAGKQVFCNHGESMNGLAHIAVNNIETGNYMLEIITPRARQSHLLKILRQ